ncbi:MAG: hemolysin III family protein [Planctomycetota bacterium]
MGTLQTQVSSIPGFYEPFSAISHLAGAGAFAVAAVVLLRRARGDARRVALFAVYSFTAVLLLSMSGVYHLLSEGSGREVLARLDKAAIFALIAGTHTPVQGLFFRGMARWAGLVGMWVVTATGITLVSVFHGDLPQGLLTSLFLALGWIAGASGLIAWRRLGKELRLLVAGGVVYSVGAVLLGLGWPNLVPGVVGYHELWHVAVLAALTLHWTFFYRHAQVSMDGPPPDRRGSSRH